MEDKTEEELKLETLEVETQLVEANVKVVELSPRFIAAKRRDLDIEVAKKLGGSK